MRKNRIPKILINRPLNRDMRIKLLVVFGMVLVAFAGLSYSLIVINRDNGEKYKKQVLSQQQEQYASTSIPYKRGNILDANGTILATTEKVYNLIIDSKRILSDEDYLEPTISALAQSFPTFDMQKIRTYISNNPESQYYVVEKRMSYGEISDFLELQNALVEEGSEETKEKDGKPGMAVGSLLHPNIQGIWFEEEYKRVYPNGTLACDALGFSGTDNNGLSGLEAYYDNTLNGTNGRTYGYLNDNFGLEGTTIPATDGYNIISTIDMNIQSIVEKHLLAYNEEYKNNARTGNGAYNVGCIIMDVHTGEIKAMASYPNFDLNNTQDAASLVGSVLLTSEGKVDEEGRVITEENKDELLENHDTLLQNLNGLWKNYCITGTFEPGSTAKPFVAAAGIDSGEMTGNEYYTCNGALEVGGYVIKCHNYIKGGDGTLSVQQSIEQSCNVALMLMANQIGKDTFIEYQQKFNLGLKTNIDLEGEARTDSLIFNTETMGPTELATSSFGQGYHVTMIQMIAAFSSLVNGGYYYEPHMVSQITTSDGAIVENIEPRLLKQTVSESVSARVREYLLGVVENGTGKTARPAGYKIGGKTGTAEMIPRDKTNYVVSFLGCVPALDPELAIYVVVDRPNVIFQDDAKHATKLIRSILTEVLPYENIFMTEELSDEEIIELEELNIKLTTPPVKEQLEDLDEGEDVLEKPEDTPENMNETSENSGEVVNEYVIEANGGDTTSSVATTEEGVGDTAPLTGSLLENVPAKMEEEHEIE